MGAAGCALEHLEHLQPELPERLADEPAHVADCGRALGEGQDARVGLHGEERQGRRVSGGPQAVLVHGDTAAVGLAGGVLAYFTLRNRGRFDLFPVIGWATLFAGFLAYVLASS